MNILKVSKHGHVITFVSSFSQGLKSLIIPTILTSLVMMCYKLNG